MKKLWQKLIITVAIALGLVVPLAPAVVAEPAYAEGVAEVMAVKTNIFGDVGTDGGEGIKRLLGLALRIFLYGIGVVAVIGVVVAGIMYLTARDNEQQVVKAKTRLIEVVIGLIVWAMLFVVLQWLIPNFNESTMEEYTGTSAVTTTLQC